MADEARTYTQEELDAVIAERDAIRANRDEALTEAKRAKTALKNYEGVDPSEFKQLKEAAAEAERKKAAAEGDFKSLEKQLVDRHTAELSVERARTEKAMKALDRRKDAKLTEALAGAEALPEMMELLLLKGRASLRLRETDDDYEEYVADEKGNPLVADGKGTPMALTDLVGTLRTQYPGAFRGSGSTGGGASKSTAGGGGGAKTIPAGDDKAFIANLEQIASGAVTVQ